MAETFLTVVSAVVVLVESVAVLASVDELVSAVVVLESEVEPVSGAETPHAVIENTSVAHSNVDKIFFFILILLDLFLFYN
jgi:hypothetical protein